MAVLNLITGAANQNASVRVDRLLELAIGTAPTPVTSPFSSFWVDERKVPHHPLATGQVPEGMASGGRTSALRTLRQEDTFIPVVLTQQHGSAGHIMSSQQAFAVVTHSPYLERHREPRLWAELPSFPQGDFRQGS